MRFLSQVGEKNNMPIYEYQCMNCQSKIEVVQKVDDPAPVCENCNGQFTTGSIMVRVISKTSFVLKGSGWYRDGYSSATDKK
jgi:putative FmdB family regulatory protein